MISRYRRSKLEAPHRRSWNSLVQNINPVQVYADTMCGETIIPRNIQSDDQKVYFERVQNANTKWNSAWKIDSL